MAVALLSATGLMIRQRRSTLSVRRRVLAAMNLFFGVMIGTMAFGHLLAVTTKLAIGTTNGPTLLFYLIGVVLAVPSWWLIVPPTVHWQHFRADVALGTHDDHCSQAFLEG